MLNRFNQSLHNCHIASAGLLSTLWAAKNIQYKIAKYTLIIPIFLGLATLLTIPWRWVITPNLSGSMQPQADNINRVSKTTLHLNRQPDAPLNVNAPLANPEAGDQAGVNLFQKIPKTPKQPFHFDEHPFYNFPPAKPIFDGPQHFQLNCNGGPIAYHPHFQCFEGPQITRYNPAGTQNGALLAHIQITAEMAKKLPHLPQKEINHPITDAFITIWGNLPDLQKGVGGGEHLMFRPETLVGKVPNSYGRLGKGLYPLKIGLFTHPNAGVIAVDRRQQAQDLATGLAVNDGLKECRYDCHGENDLPHADPLESFEDEVYLTSVMGTFDLDNGSVHAFTAVAILDPNAAQYQGCDQFNKPMVSYQILLSDALTAQIAPLFQKAENLEELIANLHRFVSTLDQSQVAAQRLQQAVKDLIHIFSQDS